MARQNTAMSPGEIADFLAQMAWVAVGSCNEDNRIFAEAAPFVLHDNRLVFSVPSASQTVQNIERPSAIVCSIDTFPEYKKIKGASVHGTPVSLAPNDLPASVKTRLSDLALAQDLPLGDAYFGLTLDDSFGFDFGKMKEKPA